ncbi:MAG TPA: magnesium/cobalt transporter CorA [Saprospiraceae bacterium]|nr:magnesium/cobalt transporter CorA [Saprospiraceae bacterium]
MPSVKIRKTGLPPGSLIYTGVQKSDQILKEFVRYNAEHIEEIPFDKEPDSNPNYHYWLDIRGIHNPKEIEEIGIRFGLDPLLLEDILDPDQRPKFELTEKGVFVILKNLLPTNDNSEFLSEQITLYLTEGRLITFQEFPDDSFRSIKIRMQQAGSRIRTRRPDYLMYAIIDLITDHYFPVLDSSSHRIHTLEEAINKNPAQSLKKSIYNVRQDIGEMHRIILPTRETINALQRTDHPVMTEKTRRYFRDVMDNIMQLLDLNDDQSDHLSSLHDLFMSEMTYRMTNVMKILTVITSIFIPLTFITSVYGMNFKYQPEYNWPWAYPVLWIIMIVIGIAQIIYFKSKKWL